MCHCDAACAANTILLNSPGTVRRYLQDKYPSGLSLPDALGRDSNSDACLPLCRSTSARRGASARYPWASPRASRWRRLPSRYQNLYRRLDTVLDEWAAGGYVVCVDGQRVEMVVDGEAMVVFEAGPALQHSLSCRTDLLLSLATAAGIHLNGKEDEVLYGKERLLAWRHTLPQLQDAAVRLDDSAAPGVSPSLMAIGTYVVGVMMDVSTKALQPLPEQRCSLSELLLPLEKALLHINHHDIDKMFAVTPAAEDTGSGVPFQKIVTAASPSGSQDGQSAKEKDDWAKMLDPRPAETSGAATFEKIITVGVPTSAAAAAAASPSSSEDASRVSSSRVDVGRPSAAPGAPSAPSSVLSLSQHPHPSVPTRPPPLHAGQPSGGSSAMRVLGGPAPAMPLGGANGSTEGTVERGGAGRDRPSHESCSGGCGQYFCGRRIGSSYRVGSSWLADGRAAALPAPWADAIVS
ncbi:unnamed protein product [Vitrella brassicaformis CCMP3155]|uniref:Uncharacterized protein n=1 Tax=Vitrella brassicaformis (strain CCMP3155) TaxID=1169540 RepID=A0A0G4F3M5_VITBC|nr:unnamed protein product [Vitrella brassicaformis CCMP3155]|eukprot:CEM06517.1 unnamed protein product [Vitrella brassicaformis CCMP3155]